MCACSSVFSKLVPHIRSAEKITWIFNERLAVLFILYSRFLPPPNHYCHLYPESVNRYQRLSEQKCLNTDIRDMSYSARVCVASAVMRVGLRFRVVLFPLVCMIPSRDVKLCRSLALLMSCQLPWRPVTLLQTRQTAYCASPCAHVVLWMCLPVRFLHR